MISEIRLIKDIGQKKGLNREPALFKKSIFSSSFLIIILVRLFCALSLLDTPEYVRCNHIGMREFLDILGRLTFPKDSEIMSHIFYGEDVLIQYFHFFQGFENFIYDEDLIKDIYLSDILHGLNRFIKSSHKFLYPPLIRNISTSSKKIYLPFSRK